MTKYHLYQVEWLDAASDHRWIKFDEIKATGITCKTVGWLVKETKNLIVLSQNMTNIGTSSDRMEIPKAWIKRKTRIKGYSIEYKTS